MSPLRAHNEHSRRGIFRLFGGASAAFLLSHCKTLPASGPSMGRPRLPWPVVFKGENKFKALCRQASAQNWASLPIGERTTLFGKALCGIPYVNYTLEIDDRIESPSVNFEGLDCWTFYEISLAMARLIKNPPEQWTRTGLLYYIELERYRNGQCDGTYASRMHHLEEVFANNEARGLGKNVTRSLGGIPIKRQVKYMDTRIAIRNSRYLRNNPALVPKMANIEAQISRLPIFYIPTSKVAKIESKLQNGDVLAIVSTWHSAYTSHVGLAVRDGSACRFMHATSSRDKGRQCLIDARISQYLREKSTNQGLIVFRPGEAPTLG